VLNLTTASDKLQLITAASTAVHVQASWMDLNTSTGAVTPGRTNTVIAAAQTSDIVAAPGASTTRNIKHLSVHAVGGAQQVTLQHTDGTTVVKIINPTLGADEHLIVNDGAGFQILDASGAVKVIAPSASGRFLKQTIYVTGSSATHTMQAGCLTVQIELIGQGGGGGGASFSSPNMGFGAGGASGGYLRKTVANPGATLTYTVGTAAGGGGANTGGTGTTGTDTTAVISGVTYTAKGGLGGVGLAAGSGLIVVAGGAGVIPTGGDMNIPGEPGNNGVRLSGVLGGSGAGGSGSYGSGGVGRTTNGTGNAGTGFGGGGGGGAAVSASVVGGAGAAGAVIVTEYS